MIYYKQTIHNYMGLDMELKFPFRMHNGLTMHIHSPEVSVGRFRPLSIFFHWIQGRFVMPYW